MNAFGGALVTIGGGQPPHPYDKATGREYVQQWTGQTPITQLWQNQAPFARSFMPQRPDRWAGPPAQLPKLFIPALAALAGARQQGFHQHNPFAWFPPMYAHPERFVMRPSIRATNQQMNGGSAAVAIPGVFAPTSPASFYGGRGST